MVKFEDFREIKESLLMLKYSNVKLINQREIEAVNVKGEKKLFNVFHEKNLITLKAYPKRAEVVNANYGEDVQFFDIEFESDYVEGLRFRVKDFMLNDIIENYMDSQDVEADVTDCWYQ